MKPLLVLIAALSLSACGSSAPEGPKIPVVSPSTEAALQGKAPTTDEAFKGFGFTCCSSESATKVVGAYVGLNEALAADDGAKAVERATALKAAAGAAIQDASLDEPSRQHAAKLVDLAGRMESLGPDLDGLRAELPDMAGPALGFARINAGGALELSAAFCPMATKPGTWLQVDPVLANPYYGAQMLRCGVFESLEDALKEG